MPRGAIDHPLYDRLVAAYREAPGRPTMAAKAAGCGYRMALRAWERGWPSYPWAPAIRDKFAQEQMEARARLLEEEAQMRAHAEKVRKEAHEQAVQARVKEGAILSAGRESTLATLLFSMNVMVGLVRGGIADKVVSAINGQTSLTPGEALDIVDRLSKSMARAVYAGHRLQEMQQKHLGSTADATGEAAPELSLDEAIKNLESVLPVLDRAKALGLHVLQGGKGTGTDGK